MSEKILFNFLDIRQKLAPKVTYLLESLSTFKCEGDPDFLSKRESIKHLDFHISFFLILNTFILTNLIIIKLGGHLNSCALWLIFYTSAILIVEE